jgi:hypothetical protein
MAGTAMKELVMTGDPQNVEKPYYQIRFPGGHVCIARTSTNEYWAHVWVNHRESTSWDPDEVEGRIVDARLDISGKHASACDPGDFADPNLYHLAVKISMGYIE